MIIDHISNIRRYQNLHKHFPEIFEYLEKTNIKALSVGKYDIIKDQAYISIDKVLPRDKKNACLEAHKKYIDIQIIFSGLDTMGWKPVLHCKKVQKNYVEEKDIIFYKDAPDFFVSVASDFFVIFLPEDAHMPLVGTEEIHKAVVKIKV
jgi:biofilm protein TabA